MVLCSGTIHLLLSQGVQKLDNINPGLNQNTKTNFLNKEKVNDAYTILNGFSIIIKFSNPKLQAKSVSVMMVGNMNTDKRLSRG